MAAKKRSSGTARGARGAKAGARSTDAATARRADSGDETDGDTDDAAEGAADDMGEPDPDEIDDAEGIDDPDADPDADGDADDGGEVGDEGDAASDRAGASVDPATRKASDEVEEDDEDLRTADDVEADLSSLLQEKLASPEEAPAEDEDEPLVDDRTDGLERLQPRRADEVQCTQCFLLVRTAAPGCPVEDDACPVFPRGGGA